MVVVSDGPGLRRMLRLDPGRRRLAEHLGVGPQPRRRTGSPAKRRRLAAGDRDGKIEAVTVAPVATEAARETEPDLIRHVTENPDGKPKPSGDENRTESPLRPTSTPDGKPKTVTGRTENSVTGRNNRKSLKAKPLLRLVSEGPSHDGKPRRSQTKKRKTAPPKTELERLKKLLPDLTDSRWTVENEGYAWKVRRVWDRGKTTESTRYFRVRWAAWEKLRAKYDDTEIAGILADKVRDKERRLAAADTRSDQYSNAG